MIGNYLIVIAGLLGLVFGSFLNTCASRWPEKESSVKPRSHCRSCGRTLAWWENIPLLSWLALRGRCRTCKSRIGWRYPLVELAVGVFWAFCTWQIFSQAPALDHGVFSFSNSVVLANGIACMIFLWLLVALAVLDAENLWLPARLTISGICLGLLLAITQAALVDVFQYHGSFSAMQSLAARSIAFWFLGAVISAGVILVIRFVYHWFRGQEGIGMGDVLLMGMLGGWFGIQRALLSFAIGVVVGAIVALLVLAVPSTRADESPWGLKKLPFGTFLCFGGMVSAFWGIPIVAAYRNWAKF